ncbi:murein DD-endopeptidase MepM/ murein hydrolase activator NlpD [Deinococcus metalli]|uniref:Murein DD-endopeptidase MepM/ murein hydrolase activator NlpD n=1 Tax=Deinococcus metalli TaxID=1141878 RepID=A0A7W8NPZ7_9DEIO|nr:M23 family metallopeptidase [Deinococcus metalli]MBB5378484.1 murein DD-endopeptidase MepM/ murein hydrolase activator NlpD [Deinococcus metalli]GHF58053.1 hypothetical protein GCM10017781_37840 [Deinococcus metalli]
MRSPLCLILTVLIGTATAVTVPVARGDTLTALAARYGTSVAALRQANPSLVGDGVRAGTRLTLPASHPAVWTVQAGDTLSSVARRQAVTLQALLNVNPGVNPQQALRIGQRLTLPSAPGQARAPTAATVRPASIRVLAALPLQGRLTTPYRTGHEGIDLAAPTGTPVRAARAGVVTESRFDARTGWGWTVVVDHGDGMTTRYSHNSANLVLEGTRVAAGQVIARVGSTGNSTGPHLDFRVVVRGTPVDPLRLD